MEVILRKNIKNLGLMGDIKQVKDGYARNYLLPKNLVEPATPGAVKNWKLGEERRQEKLNKEIEKIKKIAEKMSDVTLSFTRAVEDEKLFGSVSKVDIAKGLKTSGYEVTKDNVELASPIKELGESEVIITLYPGVTAKIKINIAATAK